MARAYLPYLRAPVVLLRPRVDPKPAGKILISLKKAALRAISVPLSAHASLTARIHGVTVHFVETPILDRLRAEIMTARSKDDRWLLVSFSYGATGMVAYAADTKFAGFSKHRVLRSPRWRGLDNAAGFHDIGYPMIVAGELTTAVLLRKIIDRPSFTGAVIHCKVLEELLPELARPASAIDAPDGFVGEMSDRYSSLGARRPGKAVRRRLTASCKFCGATRDLTLHHLVHRQMGGATEANNLLCVCRSCHERVHAGKVDFTQFVWDYRLLQTQTVLDQARRDYRTLLKGA
jgi:hypothetical protein